jgi:hypothetical protein
MKKHKIECEYIVNQFKYHNELKNELLNLIDLADYENTINDKCEVNISKTDWYNCTDEDRFWYKKIKDPLTDEIFSMYKALGYGGFRLHEIWFQQYLNNSGHGWHLHSANFTNVYYLELPKDGSITQLIEPYTKKIIELDVKEGDIITFPSSVIHRGPPNTSTNRKTIISFNVDMIYTDDTYGKGIIY